MLKSNRNLIKRSFFQNLLLLSCTLFILASVLEISCRVYTHIIDQRARMFCYDEKLGWRFLPNRRGPINVVGGGKPIITTNEAGFRDDSFEADREKTKIAVFGDSFVSNVNVKNSEVFTEVLEEKLPGTSVMNFGVNGYGQVQEYLLFEEVLKRYKPKMAVFMIYIANDFFDNTDSEGWEAAHERPYAFQDAGNVKIKIPSTRLPSKEPSMWKPVLPNIILKKIGGLHRRLKLAPSEEVGPGNIENEKELLDFGNLEILNRNFPGAVREQYQIMGGMISKIAFRAAQAKTPVLFVLAPSSFQVSEAGWDQFLRASGHAEDYDIILPNLHLMQYANKNGFPMLDLYPRLRKEFLNGVKTYHPAELHWNAEGNRVAAEEILKNLPS